VRKSSQLHKILKKLQNSKFQPICAFKYTEIDTFFSPYLAFRRIQIWNSLYSTRGSGSPINNFGSGKLLMTSSSYTCAPTVRATKVTFELLAVNYNTVLPRSLAIDMLSIGCSRRRWPVFCTNQAFSFQLVYISVYCLEPMFNADMDKRIVICLQGFGSASISCGSGSARDKDPGQDPDTDPNQRPDF